MRKLEKTAAALLLTGALLLTSCRDNKSVNGDGNTPSTRQNEMNENGEEYVNEVSGPRNSQNNQDQSEAKSTQTDEGGQTRTNDDQPSSHDEENSAPQNR